MLVSHTCCTSRITHVHPVSPKCSYEKSIVLYRTQAFTVVVCDNVLAIWPFTSPVCECRSHTNDHQTDDDDVRFSTTPELVVLSWLQTVMRKLFSLVVNGEKTHEFSHRLWENSWVFSPFMTRTQTCLLSIFFYVAFKSESCDAKQTYLKLTTADGSASRIKNLVAPRVNIRDCSFRSSPVA